MHGHEDSGITVPQPPSLSGSIPEPEPPFRIRGAPEPGNAFSIAGIRASLVGDEQLGVRVAHIHGIAALADLTLVGATATEIEISPAAVERSLSVGAATVRERILVPQTLGTIVVEWITDRETVLELGWTVPRSSDPAGLEPGPTPRWRQDGAALCVVAEHTSWFGWSTPPLDWQATAPPAADAPVPGPRLGIRMTARFRLAAGATLRLAVVVAHAAGAEVVEAVAALQRIDGIAAARVSSARRQEREQLRMESPRSDAAEALKWAQHRLRSYRTDLPGSGRGVVSGYGRTARQGDPSFAPPAHPAGVEHVAKVSAAPIEQAPPAAAAAIGLACLAAGDFETAADALACARTAAHQGPVAYLLLSGYFAAWTGQIGELRQHRTAVEQALRLLEAAPERSASAAAALRRLQNCAEAVSDRDLETRAAAAAGRARPGAVLPSAGANRAPVPTTEPAHRRDFLPQAWATLPPGQYARVLENWLTSVSQWQSGLRGGWGDSEARFLDDGGHTSSVVSDLVYGLLGADPDAAKGRLRLAPCIPVEWSRMRVTHLRLEDARLSIVYSRVGERHRFEIEQDEGGIPLNVVLEPHLAGLHCVVARVDGRAAALDSHRRNGRLAIPVQIVLDHRRTIELETGG